MWGVRAGAGISLHMKKGDIIKYSCKAGSYDFPSSLLDPMSFFYVSVQYPMFPIFEKHFYGYHSFLPLVTMNGFNIFYHNFSMIAQ